MIMLGTRKTLPRCPQCDADMHPLMLQSVLELGAPAILYRCDNPNWCGEFYMILYDVELEHRLEIYRIDYTEKEIYRRLARAHRIAAGQHQD